MNQPPKGPQPPRSPDDNGFDWPLDDDTEGLAAFPAESRATVRRPEPAEESDWVAAEAPPVDFVPYRNAIVSRSGAEPPVTPVEPKEVPSADDVPGEPAREVAPEVVPPAAVVMTGAAFSAAMSSAATAGTRATAADASTGAARESEAANVSRFELAQRARLEQRRTMTRIGAVVLGVTIAAAFGYLVGRRSSEPPVATAEQDRVSPAAESPEATAVASPTPGPVAAASSSKTGAPAGDAASVARSAAASAPASVAAAPAPDAKTGSVDITSNPPGLNVMIVGVRRGVTPLTVSGLPPGLHDVQLSRGGRGVIRKVLVSAGKTSKLDVEYE